MYGLILALAAIAAWLVTTTIRRRRTLPLPPGPKPLPIVGNVLDMPMVRPWETYAKWCHDYKSDVVYLSFPGREFVVLGSVESAIELLDKRSQIYSDRVRSAILELLDVWDLFPNRPADLGWRTQRKMFHQQFRQSNLSQYRADSTRHARSFLNWVLDTPQDARKFVRQLVTSVIVSATYGKDISGMDDAYVVIVRQVMDGFTQAILPGAFWIDFFPFLKHIPIWVPGTAAKKHTEKYLPWVRRMREDPINEVKASLRNGTAKPSATAAILTEIHEKYGGTDEEAVQEGYAEGATSIAYSAGADTTAGSAEFFLQAMALYPEVQKKAQAELDRVVGTSRLPEFDDLDKLPYVRAIMLEIFRWRPAGPFGVPHASSADDTYKGYHIPKGAMIIANIWGMLHNPDDWPEPATFRPERFLNADGSVDEGAYDKLTEVVFGFGRRICPGRHFAQEALGIYIASTLHVFEISAGFDTLGPVQVTTEIEGGLILEPRDVPCGFKPRSPAAERLIREHSTTMKHESA